MKILYATGNNSKIYNMRRRLKDLPIEIISPKDLDIKIDVLEDGTTPVENAIKKATAYYNKTKICTIAGDSGLYITKLPPKEQPGLFIRRVNKKELNDDEMIEYYSKLIGSVGGASEAYYLTGLALVSDKGAYTTEIEEDHFILTSEMDKVNNHRGNPLDVISIDPVNNKYYTQMSDEDIKKIGYKFDRECVKFIKDIFNM